MEAHLISQLVDETFSEDLTETNLISGKYYSAINSYRFIINGQVIDFPENWLFFSQIGSNVLPLEKWILGEFNEKEDPLHLIQCFEGVYERMTFFIRGEKLYLELIPKQVSDNALSA